MLIMSSVLQTLLPKMVLRNLIYSEITTIEIIKIWRLPVALSPILLTNMHTLCMEKSLKTILFKLFPAQTKLIPMKPWCKYLFYILTFIFSSSVFISFGGLLMKITGKIKDLKDLEMDSRIYLCMKKTGWVKFNKNCSFLKNFKFTLSQN